MNLLFEPAFTAWGAPTSWLELIAVTLAFICVAFNVLENPIGWPFAFVSCVLYTVLFSHHKLYGDAGVQVFFAIAALWAWWQWMYGYRRNHAGSLTVLRIVRLSIKGRFQVVLAWLVLWPAIGYLLMRVTDSDVPFFDAFPTAGSVIGQILLGLRLVTDLQAKILLDRDHQLQGIYRIKANASRTKERRIIADLVSGNLQHEVTGHHFFDALLESHEGMRGSVANGRPIPDRRPFLKSRQ